MHRLIIIQLYVYSLLDPATPSFSFLSAPVAGDPFQVSCQS